MQTYIIPLLNDYRAHVFGECIQSTEMILEFTLDPHTVDNEWTKRGPHLRVAQGLSYAPQEYCTNTS